jgi:hypothetical protein
MGLFWNSFRFRSRQALRTVALVADKNDQMFSVIRRKTLCGFETFTEYWKLIHSRTGFEGR